MTEMTQKHRLQEVADLMLKIYQTLVRMQYLDPLWIVQGPHKLDHVMPTLTAEWHKLDPNIIYLYSILPYVDHHAAGGYEHLDFFQGSGFFDARDDRHVQLVRNPLFADGGVLPTWITPLSMHAGRDKSMMFYDVKRHMIALGGKTGGSTDHVIRKREKNEMSNPDEDTLDEGNGARGEYGSLKWRDASDVLRDIVSWHEQLVETPGPDGQDEYNQSWAHETVKTHYIKHGWPGSDFDGEAFVVSKTRAEMARRAKYDAEEPIRRVDQINEWFRSSRHRLSRGYNQCSQEETVDEEWSCYWRIWRHARAEEEAEIQLAEARELMEADCPGRVCQKPEDLPLWEVWAIRRQLETTHRLVKEHLELGEKMDSAERGGPKFQRRLRFLEREARIYQKALEASQEEDDQLCPGRDLAPSATELKTKERELASTDPEAAIKESEEWIRKSQGLIEDIRMWLKRVPEEETEDVRRTVGGKIVQHERMIERCQKRIDSARKDLESGTRTPGGYGCVGVWPGA